MLLKGIHRFCRNGLRMTSKIGKVIFLGGLVMLILVGCRDSLSEEKETAKTLEVVRNIDNRDVDAEIIAEIYRDVYEKTNENESVEILEKIRVIVNCLGEKGYSAIDSGNQINMTRAEQLIQFCEAVNTKQEAEQKMIEVIDLDWFAIYDFGTKDGEVDIEKHTYYYEGGDWKERGTGTYHAEDWQYSEDGFLMFSGSWYSEELYVLTLSEAEEHKAFRVLPLDEKYRELNRKYLLPISYERNNMFLVDWNEQDFGELDFYDLYDILYPRTSGQSMPYTPDENLGIGAVYQIPKAEFEKVIMAYFNIDSETLQAKTIYNPEKATYEYKPRGLEEVEYPEYPFPEVVGYTENSDGTIMLKVNVVFPYSGMSKVYAHEVVVRPLTDGTFQYVSNRIIPSEDNYEETWHTDRLTAEEWENLYGENK